MLGRGGRRNQGGGGGGGGTFLTVANNLSDVANPGTSRANLGFTAETAGRVLLGDGSTTFTSDGLLFFDTVNKALSVNLAAPGTGATLDVGGTTGGIGFPVLTTVQRDAITPARNGVAIYNSTTDTFDGYINGAWTEGLGKGTAHSSLSGLTSGDDHTQYFLLAGRSGGQTANGGTGAGENLTLVSTANATKGKILFGTSAYNEVNNRLGIGTTTPGAPIDVHNNGNTCAQFNNIGAQGASAGASVAVQSDPGAAMSSGSRLGFYSFAGARDNASSISNGAAISAFATENWGATNAGTKLVFSVTPNTTLGIATALTINQDKTLTAAAYGTGIAHFDASGNVTSTTVNLATEVTGNLSVNNLNSGTNASSSTFWRGDGTWATVPVTKAGTVNLAQGVTSKAIAFATAFGSNAYTPWAVLKNITDPNPIGIPTRIVAHTAGGFTAEWDDQTPTGNYILLWGALAHYDP